MCIIHGKMHVTSGDKISEIVEKIMKGQEIFSIRPGLWLHEKIKRPERNFFSFSRFHLVSEHVQVSARITRWLA